MKKLNITKKQYDESSYFQKKYGKLEYVSESGKLFKTSKGKLLKFNEESVDRSDRWTKILREKYNCSWYHTNRLNVDIKWLIDNEEIGIHKGDVVSLPIKWWAQPEKESPKWNKALIDTVVYRVKDDYGIKYSKYGKDFVIVDKEKFWRDNRKWWREAGKGLAQQYKDITDRENRLKYSGWGMMESTKKFGMKSVKESIDSDPSFVCPYCGGTDCEFDYSEEVPNDDYFEGATLNAQFWCNTCDKPYNVTYELNVKDVYPNEDADSLDYDV